MKYVITGASTYGVKNMGDDAMLANMVQGIKNEDPDAEIIFLARHPDDEYDKLFGFKSQKNLDHNNNENAAGRIFFGFNKGDSTDNLVKIKDYIAKADLLIIGGNSFMQVSDTQFLRGLSSYSSTLAILAKFCGTPYALYGVNIVDPVRNQLTIQHAKFLCENAVSVTVREPEVLTYLKEMQIDLDNVEVCGDPAFGMETDFDKSKAYEILDQNSIRLNENKKTLTIGYRFEYWQNDENKFEYLAERIARLIEGLVEKYNFQVLFIPNCTYTLGNKWEDDRLVNQMIFKNLKITEDVFFIENELNVFETYCLFSLTDLHISNRRHSNAFAAMHGKIFLSSSVSLATHMSALLDNLDSPELDIRLEDDIQNTLMKVEEILLDEHKISSKLFNKASAIKENAHGHIPVILKALKKYH